MEQLLRLSLLSMVYFALGAAEEPFEICPLDVRKAFQTAKEHIEKEHQKTSPLMRKQSDAAVRQSVQQVPTGRSLEMEKNQEVFEEVTRILAVKYNLTKKQIAEDLPNMDLKSYLRDDTLEKCYAAITVDCAGVSDKYRTIDGSCNNLDNPTWGMGSSCFNSLAGANYDDGIASFRRATDGTSLPNPKTISISIHNEFPDLSPRHTHMLMMAGQFIAHDISWTPASVDGSNNPIECCNTKGDPPMQCAPIRLLDGDDDGDDGLPLINKPNVNLPSHTLCANFVRASICATCTLGPRKQTNQASSFIDLSHVYGFNDTVASETRDSGGKLKSINRRGSILLPESSHPDDDACSYQREKERCFESGDVRVNQHPALTSMHTAFMRYHNLVASSLSSVNPQWDSETVYQQSRRIVTAVFQNFVYGQFLPEVLGSQIVKQYDLAVKQTGFTKYDPDTNPTMLSEFAVAAYRFGHSIIGKKFDRINRSRNTSIDVKSSYFSPFDLYDQNSVEQFLKGLAVSYSEKPDRWIVSDVTTYMYKDQKALEGLDLGAINIQRGRDAGLATYTQMVEVCGGPKIKTFLDLQLHGLFSTENTVLFATVYKSPEDIDLFSGGLAETPMEGSILGPIFSCIVTTQFYHTKFGDRFYFEHGNLPGAFTHEQLNEIRKTNLSTILCQSTNIEKLQPNALIYKSSDNGEMNCKDYPKFDFSLWKE